MSDHDQMVKDEWTSIVYSMLADHPDWMADTVLAAQSGVTEAIDRQKDRVSKLSLGLHQALSTTRKSTRRNRNTIVEAIETSTLHPTIWSAAAIEREKADEERRNR